MAIRLQLICDARGCKAETPDFVGFLGESAP
jgi:hypothetical protein